MLSKGDCGHVYFKSAVDLTRISSSPVSGLVADIYYTFAPDLVRHDYYYD